MRLILRNFVSLWSTKIIYEREWVWVTWAIRKFAKIRSTRSWLSCAPCCVYYPSAPRLPELFGHFITVIESLGNLFFFEGNFKHLLFGLCTILSPIDGILTWFIEYYSTLLTMALYRLSIQTLYTRRTFASISVVLKCMDSICFFKCSFRFWLLFTAETSRPFSIIGWQ